jgi:hypothetical protein
MTPRCGLSGGKESTSPNESPETPPDSQPGIVQSESRSYVRQSPPSNASVTRLAHQENSNNSCSENGKENAGMLHPHASFAEEDFS